MRDAVDQQRNDTGHGSTLERENVNAATSVIRPEQNDVNRVGPVCRTGRLKDVAEELELVSSFRLHPSQDPSPPRPLAQSPPLTVPRARQIVPSIELL